MRIAVFGMGYVGVVSAVCLAGQGHEILGVEVNQAKVDGLNAGRSPIIEPGVDELLAEALRSRRFRATTDWAEAVAGSDMAWVCVGTPSLPDGGVDRVHLVDVCRQIGRALRDRETRYTVVVRSTAPPGTTRLLLAPEIARESGRPAGEGWGMCYHPEFLREGSSVEDFASPAMTVFGAGDAASGELLASLYGAEAVRCTLEEAELVKYVSNAWHGTKVAFANEVGTLARASGLDGRKVMEIFCLDDKLNLSAAYLRPGFAFGGSCLPKDLRALGAEARRLGLELPLLAAVLPSNVGHVERAFRGIVNSGARRIGLAGLSFKPGTDDLRESPYLELAARLLEYGLVVRIYDALVDPARLTGANLAYLQSRLPGAASLLVDSVETLVQEAELVVLGHLAGPDRERLTSLLKGRGLVDLTW